VLKYIIMSLLLCVSMPAAAQIASDGYRFRGDPPPIRLEFSVIVKEYDTPEELSSAIRGLGFTARKAKDIHAFAAVQGNVCTIHIIKPAKDYMPEHIGHEMVHCIYGNWHK
jgi:hypothetical protein